MGDIFKLIFLTYLFKFFLNPVFLVADIGPTLAQHMLPDIGPTLAQHLVQRPMNLRLASSSVQLAVPTQKVDGSNPTKFTKFFFKFKTPKTKVL